ncbi:acetylglutamate kinase [Enterovibrio nigricans]|uniref:Acetylglutamate kinase n=1 Tax=Enterovibrio nigricans DSM 22720 TaxID=1121868 RepID=A0A1T4U9D0_9GAMM|nr:acetylglutamate kinase [Enterovibrio nigricans]PKF51543.1 acetylglutamate kinase [Enterovibrio nigricans]SKA49138.1 N-acetylglutamate kinase [Enterovibrio nigricans DSM 22720]
MSLRPLVVKLGGAALSCTETLEKLFSAMSEYKDSAHRELVIVHGGGYLVDDLMKALNLKVEKKQGLRVTPKDQINVVAGALAGTANKLLQGEAIKSGINAVGLSLADGGLCKIEQFDPELGNVGKASPGSSAVLQAILSTGAVPIISSIGIDEDGELMNVNADQAAVAVAAALDAELVLLSDVSGVLNGKGKLMPTLDEKLANELIESGVITDGMIVKVNAAFDAAKALGRPIEVATWRYPEKLSELFNGGNIGTRFTV